MCWAEMVLGLTTARFVSIDLTFAIKERNICDMDNYSSSKMRCCITGQHTTRMHSSVKAEVARRYVTAISVHNRVTGYLRGPTTPTIDQYKPFRGKFDSPRLKSRSLT